MVKVQNIERLQARLRAIPQSVLEAARKADEDNADEFMNLVASTVPKGDEAGKGGERLYDTLERGPSKLGIGQRVSIGGPEAPYPAHLEFGHMAKGGRHVPGKPFWYPALRILKKKFRDRRSRLTRGAIKALTAGGS